MGHKNLKQHYKIDHIVCVNEKGICIGSPYIHDLIVISLDGVIIKADDQCQNEDLRRYLSEMKADPEKLKSLIQSPDKFEESITVYTYEEGEIIEKKCEKAGWPNVTHDGDLMYENTYSTDKSEIVRWAKTNESLGVRFGKERIKEIESDMAKAKKFLEEAEANLAKLNKDYPEVKYDAPCPSRRERKRREANILKFKTELTEGKK